MRMRMKSASKKTLPAETLENPQIVARPLKTSNPRRSSRRKWVLDPETFPSLPEGLQRTLYVAGLEQSKLEALKEKGYSLVDVRTMPRESMVENRACIEAWMQGLSEGTIEENPERRRNLELEAKAHGLLVHKQARIDLKVKADADNLDKVLDQLSNLTDTLKPVSHARIEAAKKAALIPGFRSEEEDGIH
jgi:hypothetical protein